MLFAGPGAPDGYLSMIHNADIGNAVVAAFGIPSGAWNLVDDQPITRREFIGAVAEVAGRSKIFDAGRIFFTVAGQQREMAARSHRVSNRLFRNVGGWALRYSSVFEGFAAMHAGGRTRAPARP